MNEAMMETTEMMEANEPEESAVANETKAEKFTRLAIPRMNKLIAGIESLGKLGNRGTYDYTEEQVAKMFESLRRSLDDAESKFRPKVEKEKGGFTF
ncbi:MAG: hypothetical protein J6Y90_07515 [Lachnospiraceae bacterium]|nr:hypothetical protein [Lachnospiraceae bacterium]